MSSVLYWLWMVTVFSAGIVCKTGVSCQCFLWQTVNHYHAQIKSIWKKECHLILNKDIKRRHAGRLSHSVGYSWSWWSGMNVWKKHFNNIILEGVVGRILMTFHWHVHHLGQGNFFFFTCFVSLLNFVKSTCSCSL